MNAAIWLTTASFLACEPVVNSQEMKELLGARNFPYFSVAFSQLVQIRYVRLFLVCGIVALLHIIGEWLYLGKYPRRVWLGLVLSFFLWGLFQNYWVYPSLRDWHRIRYSQQANSAAAGHAFRLWHGVSE